MGFLDSLLGNKTNNATAQATRQVASNNMSTLNDTSNILNQQYGTATNALSTGASNATNAINDLYGQATGAVKDYGSQALDFLNTGANNAAGLSLSSNDQYSPYVSSGQGATSLLADALGVNGTTGNQNALDSFQAGPGYQWQVDQATDAAARKAASLGMTASGNTLDAITRLGSNLANGEFQQWLSNLSGLGTQGLSAANSVSGNNNTAAGVLSGAATTGAGLLNNQGSVLGQILSNQGNNLGNIENSLGTNQATLATNLGNSLVNNNWHATDSTNKATLANGTSQDAADSANNGILNQILGKGLDFVTSGGLGKLSKGLKL